MTTKELKRRVRDIGFAGYGHHKIEILYRGKYYTCVTTNTLATDRLRGEGEIPDKTKSGFYTLKEALYALYNECKRKNSLEWI